MFKPQQKQQLLSLAQDSILWGLRHGRALSIRPDDYDEELQQQRACFVTLHIDHQLRGCIGSLEAHRPLVDDICENAFAAAFRDPRFSPLKQYEFEQLELSISVLTPSVEMEFTSEQNCLDQIRPGIDGLILQQGQHRGTFLPAVWEQLPEPEQFMRHLKQKAGLAANFWSDKIKISRYQTESFE